MNREISITFTVAGDPEALSINELAAMNIDAIEIGVAFSDPVAESPTVQKANLRALDDGARNGAVEAAIELVRSLRTKTQAKLVLYSYYNPIFRFGLDRFFIECAKAGVDGVTIADMPFEEHNEAKNTAQANKIALLSSIATTDISRAKQIAAEAEGYLRIEPVGDVTQRQAVLEAVLESSVVPYACCELAPAD